MPRWTKVPGIQAAIKHVTPLDRSAGDVFALEQALDHLIIDFMARHDQFKNRDNTYHLVITVEGPE